MRLVPHDGLDGFQFGDVRDFDDVALCERAVGIPQVVKRMVRHVVVAHLQVARASAIVQPIQNWSSPGL